MTDDARLSAIEETLMRMQSELDQLDEALRAQIQENQALTRRVDHLERRLARLEPDDDSDQNPPLGKPSQMNTDGHR